MSDNKENKIITEFKKYNSVMEQAQATFKNEIFVQLIGRIYVYGGEFQGNQREHGLPHFKLVKNDDTEYRILIPQIKITELMVSDIEVLDGKNIERIEKRKILHWLLENSKSAKNLLGEEKTNLMYIGSIWNMLNSDDNNIQILDLSLYK